MPVGKYYKGSGKKVMAGMKAQYGEEKGERVFYATANKMGMKPRNAMSKSQRAMRDRSTRGSPPMHMKEMMCGYRRLK